MTRTTNKFPPGVMGTRDAALVLGIDRSTLIRKVTTGEVLPLARLDSGAWVFDEDEIERVRAAREASRAKVAR